MTDRAVFRPGLLSDVSGDSGPVTSDPVYVMATYLVLHVALTNGSPQSWTCKLQGSIDLSHWVDLISVSNSTADGVGTHSENWPWPYIRVIAFSALSDQPGTDPAATLGVVATGPTLPDSLLLP